MCCKKTCEFMACLLKLEQHQSINLYVISGSSNDNIPPAPKENRKWYVISELRDQSIIQRGEGKTQ